MHLLLSQLLESGLLDERQFRAAQQAIIAGEIQNHIDLANWLLQRGWLTQWQATEFSFGNAPMIVGDYVLLDRVGTGSMSRVYKARHTQTGRVVAIKILQDHLVRDQEALARFQREARVCLQLSHPHLVQAISTSLVQDFLTIVFEYIDGYNLKEWLNLCGKLPVPVACDCIAQVARGLDYAHARGLVHRDVNPTNMMVSFPYDNDRPHLKLLDLGLAHLAANAWLSEQALSFSGKVLGTPAYLAPEQILPDMVLDARADIYSLGCSLFHLLTGSPPFVGPTPMQVIMARLSKDVLNMTALMPQVPAELRAIVARMMAIQPDDRFSSCQTVADVLSRYITYDT